MHAQPQHTRLTSSHRHLVLGLLPLGEGLLGGGFLGELLAEGDELWLAGEVLSENLRYAQTLKKRFVRLVLGKRGEHDGGIVFPQFGGVNTHIWCLVVLEDAADCPGSGAEGRVEAVDVLLLRLRLGLCAVADLEGPGLVVGAVGAGHELLVLALEGEPGLEVELLGGGVVERPGYDGDDLVGEAEALVELLGDGDHVVEGVPGLLGVGEEELLDLLELVHAVDSPGVPTV